jgi:CubicO group peptidase (beta-lactamase class C family)
VNRFVAVLFLYLFSILCNFAYASDYDYNERVDIIKSAVSKYLAERFLNATFIFADEERVLDMGAKGVSSLETGIQLKVNGEMPIASATKPMTAAAILKLYDLGLLDVHDKVAKYINHDSGLWYGSVPKWAEQVSIHHLLTHSSGLQEYFLKLYLNYDLSLEEMNKSILNFATEAPLQFMPGSKYSYANTNYIILGLIVEKVSGKSFAEFLSSQIFKPLAMKRSHLADHAEYIKIREGLAKNPYPKRYWVVPTNGKPVLELVKENSYFVPYADGGVISNTADVIKFYRALHGKKILSEKAYKMMTSKYLQIPKDKSGRKTYVGYGLYISELNQRNTMIHHSGRFEGSMSESGYIPEQKVYFAIIGNVSTKLSHESVAVDFSKPENQLDLVYFREAVLKDILR